MSGSDRRDHVDALSPGERLIDTLRKRDRNLLLQLAVASPGTLVSYDPSTQRGDVQLAFRRVEDTEPDETVEPPMVIPQMRVCWYRSANAYLTLPILAGATGVVLFCDRALDEWYRNGGAVDPIDARAHSFADGVFFPTLAPDDDTLPTPPTPDAAVLEAPNIYLGSGALDFVALAQKVLTELQNIKTAFDSHTHTYNPGPSPPATTTPPVAPMPAPGSVAADKTRAE